MHDNLNVPINGEVSFIFSAVAKLKFVYAEFSYAKFQR